MDDEALAARLAQQDGVVSRRQLSALGCRPHDAKRLLRRRLLAPVHPGVYVGHTGAAVLVGARLGGGVGALAGRVVR